MIKPLVAVSLVVLAGCSAGTTSAENLTATLVSPTGITLAWHPTDADAAGQVVEYTNEQDTDYVILGFVLPTQTTYKHPDLVPRTPFYYRIRPYFGTASATVDVSLPPGDIDPNVADDGDWARPKTIPSSGVSTSPVRQAGSAPTDLTPTIANPNGITFTWTDHSSDEEGFYLETKADGSQEFLVAAVLDPDVNSVGLTILPEEKKATYRVRPFKYGQATNVAKQTTGESAG